MFCSQRTSHIKPSATSITVTGPVRERLQAGTENAAVLRRQALLRRLHDSGAGYKYPELTYLLTKVLTRNLATANRPYSASQSFQLNTRVEIQGNPKNWTVIKRL